MTRHVEPRDSAPLRRGLAAALASATSTQTGAGIGAHAFATLGPAGVVAVRQLVAVLVLMTWVRPPIHRFTRGQLWPVLLLGLSFASMNLGLYAAVDRVGLGLAVTLEFLGPLAVALAGSRRAIDLGCAAAATLGIYVLVLPDASTDWAGVGLGLLAAASWAAYILLNRTVGRRLPGLQGTAAAALVSASALLPVVVWLAASGRLLTGALVFALVAGVLSSVVPFTLDLTALRTVPAPLFGILMSLHPVLAMLTGLVLLAEVPEVHALAGMLIVVVTNVVAIGTQGAGPGRTGVDRAQRRRGGVKVISGSARRSGAPTQA